MKCFGYGYFIDDPRLSEVQQGEKTINVTSFKLRCPEQDDKLDREVLRFEAWHTAAAFICKTAKQGDIIRFEAVPREYFITVGEEKIYKTKFRIKEFTISKLV